MSAPWDSCSVAFDIDLKEGDMSEEELEAIMLPLPAGWKIGTLEHDRVEFDIEGPLSVRDGVAVARDLVQLGLRPKPRE